MNDAKWQLISARILEEVAMGRSVREAVDAVLGVGVSDALIADLYAELRARGGK